LAAEKNCSNFFWSEIEKLSSENAKFVSLTPVLKEFKSKLLLRQKCAGFFGKLQLFCFACPTQPLVARRDFLTLLLLQFLKSRLYTWNNFEFY